MEVSEAWWWCGSGNRESRRLWWCRKYTTLVVGEVCGGVVDDWQVWLKPIKSLQFNWLYPLSTIGLGI